MPEPRNDASLRLVAVLLTTSGVVTLLGAVVAYATGEDIYMRGGVVRTHLDAVWVLAVLGLAMVTSAFAVIVSTASEAQMPSGRDAS